MRQMLLTFLITFSALSVNAADTQTIEQRMTPETRKATGLDKLSPAELAALNSWLDENMSEKAIRKSMIGFPVMHLFGGGGEDPEPIETRIDGEFRGWSGSDTFTLDNGQVWQQIEKGTLYARPVSNPKVTIKPAAMGTWMLKVEGYNRPVRVQRVK